MMKFAAMAAMVAAAPGSEDWAIDLDMLQGGLGAADQTYYFPSNQKVTITAIEHRSWGYSWDIKNECGLKFKLVDDQFGYEEGNQLLGRSGKRTLVFETAPTEANELMNQPCEITFTNKRPWLQEADSPDQVKKIRVNVGELMGSQ